MRGSFYDQHWKALSGTLGKSNLILTFVKNYHADTLPIRYTNIRLKGVIPVLFVVISCNFFMVYSIHLALHSISEPWSNFCLSPEYFLRFHVIFQGLLPVGYMSSQGLDMYRCMNPPCLRCIETDFRN